MNAFRTMSTCVVLVTMGHAQGQHYRFEVDLVVTENTVIGSGLGGDLASLTVGTQGSYEFLVDAVPLGPNPDPANGTSLYRVLDVSFHSGTYDVGGAPGVYPSGDLDTARAMFVIDDSGPVMGRLTDTVLMGPLFDTDDFGEVGFAVGQQVSEPNIPNLLADSSLPSSLDLELATTTFFYIDHPENDFLQVRYAIESLRIIEVPAPVSAGVLAFAGLAAMRRRR